MSGGRKPIIARNIWKLVDALGGPTAVAKLCGRTPAAVCSWRSNGSIPPEFYFIIRDAAAGAGYDAPVALFRFERPVVKRRTMRDP